MYMYIYKCIYICIYIFIYTYIYINTYTCTLRRLTRRGRRDRSSLRWELQRGFGHDPNPLNTSYPKYIPGFHTRNPDIQVRMERDGVVVTTLYAGDLIGEVATMVRPRPSKFLYTYIHTYVHIYMI